MSQPTKRFGWAIDLDDRASVDRFRKAAKKFTEGATRSKKIARTTLVGEGIYTSAGKLSRKYR